MYGNNIHCVSKKVHPLIFVITWWSSVDWFW